MDIDYCINCGKEHGYMCGPCDHCGKKVFTKEKPKLKKVSNEIDNNNHTHSGFTYWVKDYQGIELCKVCDDCQDYRLARYRPEILRGYSQNDVDESIEEN